METASAQDQNSGYYGFRNIALITDISYQVRSRIFRIFMTHFSDVKSIVDVGATSESSSKEANVLESLHPHKDRITAVGIEPGKHLEIQFPGVKYVQIAPGEPLPFKEKVFGVSYSHAVIEHIVVEEEQVKFIKELARVGERVFITTPNKFFPIEPHTMTPFLHFVAPPLFYYLLDKGWINKFYRSSNLKLLTASDLRRLAEKAGLKNFQVLRSKYLGFTTNLILTGSA